MMGGAAFRRGATRFSDRFSDVSNYAYDAHGSRISRCKTFAHIRITVETPMICKKAAFRRRLFIA
jgi:hypothetical protein